MKKFNHISKALLTVGMAMAITSCSKFEEDLNKNPQAASEDQVQVEYFINSSIVGSQMNPDVAERAFVLYWKAAGRQHKQNFFSVGSYDDGYSSAYYNQSASWMNRINVAVQLAEKKIAEGDVAEYVPNLLQVARIWRAYLLSEFSDNFGPAPIVAFNAENPQFASTKDIYYYCLEELRDASAKLDIAVANPDAIKKQDPSYEYNFAKWQKYANSMRLRLAMRLSEVDPTKAKGEFEDAAGKPLITAMDESFQVQEVAGWSDLSGVMSREWNGQLLSATLNNIYVGLGGVESETLITNPDVAANIKPADYIGLRFADHFTTMTNEPSAGYWFDGIPNKIDPRAYQTFMIPGDVTNPNYSNYPTYASDPQNTTRNLLNEAGAVVKTIDAKYTWNATAIGDWATKGATNQVYAYLGTNPRLAQKYRNNSQKRIFFAPWETYFLLAEAAVRGWTVPGSAQENYEKGIRASFAYHGVSERADAYLASEDYNRVGTSVKFTHTTEPGDTHPMKFINGYTGVEGTANINYPKNTLYKNGTVRNDALTKIITQKFIAQTPWLPLETWSDHRRLGLPFFDNPAVEKALPNMPALNSSNYMTSQVKFFPQRLRYPSGFANNDPNGYAQAIGFLNGPDEVLTPLWWAKQD